MAVIAPCDPLEVADATWACVRRDGPTYLRLGKAGEPHLTADAVEPFAFGKLRLVQDGRDVCIIGYGPILAMARDVATRLEEDGSSVALVSAHTVKPLDVEGVAN